MNTYHHSLRWAGSLGAAVAGTTAAGAGWALVLLDVLGLGRRDLDALAVEPLLAEVAADPKLIGAVAFLARAAQRLPVLPLACTAIFLLTARAFLCRGTQLCLLHLRLRWFLHVQRRRG